jgi:hypothetical protein
MRCCFFMSPFVVGRRRSTLESEIVPDVYYFHHLMLKQTYVEAVSDVKTCTLILMDDN